MPIDTEYLTPPMVAKYLSCGHNQVISHIHSGDLQAFDLSKQRGDRPRWRITEQILRRS